MSLNSCAPQTLAAQGRGMMVRRRGAGASAVIVQSHRKFPLDRSEIAAIEWRMSRTPAYQEAYMGSADVADRENRPIDELDEVANLLMASLQESKALNHQIHEALLRRDQASAVEEPERTDSEAGVFQLLRNIIDGAPPP
jgi:hypothetical protein